MAKVKEVEEIFKHLNKAEDIIKQCLVFGYMDGITLSNKIIKLKKMIEERS